MLMLRLLAEISDGSVDDDGRVVGGRHQALPMAEVVDDGVARSTLRELSADPLSCLQSGAFIWELSMAEAIDDVAWVPVAFIDDSRVIKRIDVAACVGAGRS